MMENMQVDTYDIEQLGCPDVSGVEDLLHTFLEPSGPEVTDGELCDGLVALDRLRSQAEAAIHAAVDRFDARQVYVGDGMRSTVAWLRSRTEMSVPQASAVVREARALRSCPATRAAFAAARLGLAKVRLLLKARDRVEELFSEHETDLVAFVVPLTVSHAQTAIEHWRRLALASLGSPDEDGPLPADPQDGNRLHLSQVGNRWRLDGDLDLVSGEQLSNAIAAVVDSMFRNAIATSTDGIARSHRNAQALIELTNRGAQPGTRHGEQRPSVALVRDITDLLGAAVDGPGEILRHRSQLVDGSPIGRPTADRLLCNADITELLVRYGLDGAADVVGVSHRHRLANARQRKALAERDKGCVFPGCDAPVGWTDAHHTIPYELSRITRLEDLVLLCRFHHHRCHEGGFGLTRDPGGTISVTRPDGTMLPRAVPGRLAHEPPGSKPAEGCKTEAHGAPEIQRNPRHRPASRFRTMAERHDVEARAVGYWRKATLRNAARLGLTLAG